ncbi:ATP-dependent DNA helicase -like [Paramuricea clavata]|uniref:DNA 3'-5' helicase n=1 Tax=Paramuricea clavata TaxID=317549 RepID=A0A6S7IEP3_PARCT|nr:ATP-dependent DNA helicase -like [Paramuricea clavata]
MRQDEEKRDGTMLVICPLRSLMEDQIREAADLGISASSLPEANFEDVNDGKFQVIYSFPECALEQGFIDACLKNENGHFHNNMAAVVIDECHTIETWTGKRVYFYIIVHFIRKSGARGEKTRQAFRGRFGDLSHYCTYYGGTPFLALTGTADKSTLNVIKSDLLLKNPDCVFVSSERKNIRFSVRKVTKGEMFYQLSWLIKLIKDNGACCPKTLILCNTLNDVAAAFNHLMLQLGANANNPPESREPECTGNKRVVVASSALGMGVNFPDIKYVINWGHARNLLDQLQEGRRAGRNGSSAHIVIIYHGQQVTHCDKDVKEFVNTTGCYRLAAYVPFDPSIQPGAVKHDCCNYCCQSCQ